MKSRYRKKRKNGGFLKKFLLQKSFPSQIPARVEKKKLGAKKQLTADFLKKRGQYRNRWG